VSSWLCSMGHFSQQQDHPWHEQDLWRSGPANDQ
jgi:hypothetical protein